MGASVSLSVTFFLTLEASLAFCLLNHCLLDRYVSLPPSASCGSCGTDFLNVFFVLYGGVIFNNETQREAERDLQRPTDLQSSSVALAMLEKQKYFIISVKCLTSVGRRLNHPLDFRLGFRETLFVF